MPTNPISLHKTAPVIKVTDITALRIIEESEKMTIGKVIRKYRKELGLTQEEMATSLGVTTPAVNKWENENTLPDINLLAPIARLLGISTDELLSFKDNLTDEEVDVYIKALHQKLAKEPYEDLFDSARKKIEEYPNCEKLKWKTAQILDFARLKPGFHNLKKYDKCISAWFLSLVESEDETIKKAAGRSLFLLHFREENYDKAEQFLIYYDEISYERRLFQAEIYEKKGKTEEAFKTYEDLMLDEANKIKNLLRALQSLNVNTGNLEMAYRLADISIEVTRCFDLGAYQEILHKIDLVVYEKDVDKTASLMKQLIESADTILDFGKSDLYIHLRNNDKEETDKSEFIKEYRANIITALCNDERFGYMRGNDYWETLRKKQR